MSYPVRVDVGIKDAIALLVLVFAGIQLNLLLMDQTAMFHHAAASLGINLLVFQMASQCLIGLTVVIVYMFVRAMSDPSRSWLRELGVIRPADSALAIGLVAALAT